MQKAVFFDRDGVINKPVIREGKPYPPATIEEFQFNDGIQELTQTLERAGFKLFVFTNQPDVARGTKNQKDIEQIHDYVSEKLHFTKIYACYHDNDDNCQCRKPKPGMIALAQKEFDIDLAQSFAIGDRWRDIDAAAAIGVKSIFIDYNYDEQLRATPDYTVKSLSEIKDIILPT